MEFRLHAREEFMIGNAEKRRAIAQSLGVKYVYDRGDVAIELHPLLAYHCEPQNAVIEPPKIGSGTEKNDNSASLISFGRTGGIHLELKQESLTGDSSLSQLFKLAAEEGLQFPWKLASLHVEHLG